MNAPPTHDAPPTRDVPPTCDAPPTCDGQPTRDAPPTCDDPPIRTDISTPLTPPVGSKSPNSGLGSKLKPMTQATQHLVGAVEYRLEVAVSNVVTDILLESSPGKTVLRNMKRKKKWKEVVADVSACLLSSCVCLLTTSELLFTHHLLPFIGCELYVIVKLF